MSVYRKFTRNDILFSTIHSRPRVAVKYGLANGLTGWSGNSGVSGSLSLYGGVRARYNVKASDFQSSGLSIYPLDLLDTHSIDNIISVSGSYPATGSIRFVRCENKSQASLLSETDTHWLERHYRPIDLLFDSYSTIDNNYFTGSYDFYDSLLLANFVDTAEENFGNPGSFWSFSGTLQNSPSLSGSSFTAEARIKLLPHTGSISGGDQFTHHPTFMAQRHVWSLWVNPNGTIAYGPEIFPAPGSANSTTTILPGVWTTVTVVVDRGVSASFYVDGVFSNTAAIPQPSQFNTGSQMWPLMIGAYHNWNGVVSNSMNGFIFETKMWTRALSGSEISQNASGTMINSSSVGLVHYARFNDGPAGVAHGFVSGSGAFDYSPNAKHGQLIPYSFAHVNHWQPNDHPTFIPVLKKANLDIKDLRLFHVPSMFYGKQIDPGSVRITDGVYNKRKIVRVFKDDGRGSLYVSGSMTRDISSEEYTGQKRRKVGNVFYSEGLIVFTDPALYDMFDSGSIFWQPTISVSGVFGDLLSAEFLGQTKIYTKTFNCRLGTAQGNASNNKTFSKVDDNGTITTDDDRIVVERHDGVTYITSVGLYNEDRELVAIAKLAQPIRKREKDKINIRLKMDF